MTLKQLLNSDCKILGFGETNHGTHASVFKHIFKHKPTINGILLELPISLQKSINSFLKNHKTDHNLISYINGAKMENKNIKPTLMVILDYASNNNLQIYCIDASKLQTSKYPNKTKTEYFFTQTGSREKDMYLHSISHLVNSNLKWLIISGSSHLKNGINYRTGDQTLGSQLKNKFSDKFISVCLWKPDSLHSKTKSLQIYNSQNPRLINLLAKNNLNNLNEKNQTYFDYYLIHN